MGILFLFSGAVLGGSDDFRKEKERWDSIKWPTGSCDAYKNYSRISLGTSKHLSSLVVIHRRCKNTLFRSIPVDVPDSTKRQPRLNCSRPQNIGSPAIQVQAHTTVTPLLALRDRSKSSTMLNVVIVVVANEEASGIPSQLKRSYRFVLLRLRA